MAKQSVKCEECGEEFSENGIYDLANTILYHFKSGDCEERKLQDIRNDPRPWRHCPMCNINVKTSNGTCPKCYGDVVACA